jgi:hypothetical protein
LRGEKAFKEGDKVTLLALRERFETYVKQACLLRGTSVFEEKSKRFCREKQAPSKMQNASQNYSDASRASR